MRCRDAVGVATNAPPSRSSGWRQHRPDKVDAVVFGDRKPLPGSVAGPDAERRARLRSRRDGQRSERHIPSCGVRASRASGIRFKNREPRTWRPRETTTWAERAQKRDNSAGDEGPFLNRGPKTPGPRRCWLGKRVAEKSPEHIDQGRYSARSRHAAEDAHRSASRYSGCPRPVQPDTAPPKKPSS